MARSGGNSDGDCEPAMALMRTSRGPKVKLTLEVGPGGIVCATLTKEQRTEAIKRPSVKEMVEVFEPIYKKVMPSASVMAHPQPPSPSPPQRPPLPMPPS